MNTASVIAQVNDLLSKVGLPAYGNPNSLRLLTMDQARAVHNILAQLSAIDGSISSLSLGKVHVSQAFDGGVEIREVYSRAEERYKTRSELAKAYGIGK